MLRQVKSSGRQVSRSAVIKELFFCGLSAALLILALPRFNIEFLAWFGFVPWLFAIKNKSKTKAFFISYLTGIFFWSGIIYWLVHVTFIGMTVLILYLALYFGIFGLIISSYELRVKRYELILIPSAWVLLEYLRSHLFTGFAWALLGYTQYLNLPIIQIADITGIWGISFLVMMVNAALYLAFSCRLSVTGIIKRYLMVLLCISLTLGYGYYKLYRRPSRMSGSRAIKISIVQANIPQELKWDKNAHDLIIGRYLSLTGQAVKDNPDLIIWPEAALPYILEEEALHSGQVSSLLKELPVPLLLGAATSRNSLYYNSALLVSENRKVQAQYDKLHLVPFGEYVPLRKILRFLETIVPIGDFASGKEYTLFKVQSKNYKVQTNFSVLICFEDLFPELSREFVKRGAEFLVNITNDAWFKRTSAPYQHLCASVFRAVENRVFLVRAANTGVSGFISSNGENISLVKDRKGRNIFVSGYDTHDVSVSKGPLSFYTRYGDIFILVCFIFVLFLTVVIV